ncbi:SDR family NAD(P)-dependent oxidoreductase [Sphaerisporangium perillae]|uniref:SDR family NAD(P)-dependent oxidoreductase n=1 Tax=Sphaerisporangium perillae TaxID=2935860 RepID=UPI00200FFB39|nr:SDR family NAD(P)-dependent oxidoreductase [Sphaerisporangium perillae]
MVGNILITGGASGLGRAVAVAVAKAGGRPLVVDVTAPEAGIDYVSADVSDREQVERAMRELAERAGGLDGVVTAAGIDACGALSDVPAPNWERVVQVNLLGTASIVRAALPYLRRSGGRVVTCASTLGLRAVSDATAYCAAKFGVVGFTRAALAPGSLSLGKEAAVNGGRTKSVLRSGVPERL